MSSGVALAILASVLVTTFAVLAFIRMRRTFEDPPVSRSGPGPSMELGTRSEPVTEGTRPTLVPARPVTGPEPLGMQPMKATSPRKRKSTKPSEQQQYVAALEDEDDVPTTLYQKDDDPDVEALLAEFDDEDHKRKSPR